jgi:Protein of unknown function (DUF4232)
MAATKFMFALTVAGAMMLTGCHSTTVAGSAGPANPAPSTAVSVQSSTASASAPAPAVTVTKTVAAPPNTAKPATGCTTSQVNVVVGQNSGAAGTLVQEMDVHNTSTHTCTLKGHPFISAYGKLKQGSTTVEATLDDITVDPIPSSFGALGVAATTQTLTPGDYAVFFLKWSHVPVGSKPCVDADGYDFRTPADSSIQHLITFAFTVCGGELQVSNVVSKSSGL